MEETPEYDNPPPAASPMAAAGRSEFEILWVGLPLLGLLVAWRWRRHRV